ncbi:MAG TPA: VWA domain-containing protein [Caldilineae bacterium]|nr:VWA domain-containing protein [Caldilineae bacterium]
MKTQHFAFAVILTLALLLALVPGASAQGIGDPLPPIGGPIGGPISTDLYSVDAIVDGPVVTVHVTQVFRNQADWQVEGTYIFPLPANAAIGDFQMTVDGQVLEGQVLDSDEARDIYEAIVRRRQDPALLEYLGQGLFQTSAFPIPPGETRKLELTYTHTLDLQDGLYHFRYPLQTRQYSAAPVKDLAVRVELRNQPGLRTLYSPSHDVSIDRIGDDAVLVSFEAHNIQPERDFDLYFGVSEDAIGLNLLSTKPAGEDGFFLLLAAPGIEIAPDEVIKRDLILVMDISGSMRGTKVAQAQDAAHFLVDNLNPGDRFNLIAFSTGASLWSAELRPGDSDSRRDAHQWIDRLSASGSTDINRALLEVLAQLQNPSADSRLAYVLFMTDGLPTQGETNADRIIANALNNLPADRSIRLFTFGVGYYVDTRLLDTLSSELGGRSSYVKPGEGIDEAIGDFYERISTPVLSDVTIDLPGILTDDTYPFPLPDLFAGEQLTLVGRYRTGGDTAVTLSGFVNGQKRSFTYPDRHLVEAGGEPHVARLWATRKIGTLLDQVRRQGADQELIDAIVDLSKTYGIVTPYTSYLVMEPDMPVPVVRGTPIPWPPPRPIPMETPMEMPAAESSADVVIKEVQVTVVVEKAMEVSGQAAVGDSETRTALRLAERAQEHEDVRYVAGKTFTFQQYVVTPDDGTEELWVDNSYREAVMPHTILFGSDEYFELAGSRDVAQWLAISPELMLMIEDNAYRITTDPALSQDTAPEPLASPQPTPAPPAAATQTFWESILAWLEQVFAFARRD